MPNVATCIWTGPCTFQAAARRDRSSWPRSFSSRYQPSFEVSQSAWQCGPHGCMAVKCSTLHHDIMLSWTTASTSEWNTITIHSQTNTLRLPNFLYYSLSMLTNPSCPGIIAVLDWGFCWNWPAAFSKKYVVSPSGTKPQCINLSTLSPILDNLDSLLKTQKC